MASTPTEHWLSPSAFKSDHAKMYNFILTHLVVRAFEPRHKLYSFMGKATSRTKKLVSPVLKFFWLHKEQQGLENAAIFIYATDSEDTLVQASSHLFTFNTMPDDIQMTIFDILDLVTATCLGLTCKKFYAMSEAVHGKVELDQRACGGDYNCHHKSDTCTSACLPLGGLLSQWAGPNLLFLEHRTLFSTEKSFKNYENLLKRTFPEETYQHLCRQRQMRTTYRMVILQEYAWLLPHRKSEMRHLRRNLFEVWKKMKTLEVAEFDLRKELKKWDKNPLQQQKQTGIQVSEFYRRRDFLENRPLEFTLTGGIRARLEAPPNGEY